MATHAAIWFVEKVRLRGIMPLAAQRVDHNAMRNARYVWQGTIDPFYRISTNHRDKCLDDDVDRNKYGRSNWHIDAVAIWALPADQREIAEQVALQNISDTFAAVLFPLHYTLRHLATRRTLLEQVGA